jgi:hypothetical protein
MNQTMLRSRRVVLPIAVGLTGSTVIISHDVYVAKPAAAGIWNVIEHCDEGDSIVDGAILWNCVCEPAGSENCNWVPIGVISEPSASVSRGRARVYSSNIGKVNVSVGIAATSTGVILSGNTLPLDGNTVQYGNQGANHLSNTLTLQRWFAGGGTWVNVGNATSVNNSAGTWSLDGNRTVGSSGLTFNAYYRAVSTGYKYNNGWKGGSLYSGSVFYGCTYCKGAMSSPPPAGDSSEHVGAALEPPPSQKGTNPPKRTAPNDADRAIVGLKDDE